MSASQQLLAVEDLEVTYNGIAVAVSNLSLTVARGEIVAILGPNGAGKTTSLRAIGGLLPSEPASITRGTIVFDGNDIARKPPQVISRAGISLVPERDKIFGTLTVEENLRVVPDWHGRSRRSERTAMLTYIHELFPILRDRESQRANLLSGGEKQMLAVARALMMRPKLLLCDEPSLGISPLLVTELMRALRQINTEMDTSVLLVEQNATAALGIADRAVILESGRVAVAGSAQELIDRDDVKATYLGHKALSGRGGPA